MTLRGAGQGAILVASLGLIGLLVWRLLGLYDGPWAAFIGPGKAFLEAAAAHDSTELQRSGASATAITKALRAAIGRPVNWSSRSALEPLGGKHLGDTTRIAFASEACPDQIVSMTFVRAPSRIRVVDVELPCRPASPKPDVR